jgi:hypothetical protein
MFCERLFGGPSLRGNDVLLSLLSETGNIQPRLQPLALALEEPDTDSEVGGHGRGSFRPRRG